MKKTKIQCSYCGNLQSIEFRNCNKCGREMPEKKNVGEATKLFDESRPATYLVKVTCSNCGHEGKPEKWSARNILGILFIISGLIPGLIFFNSTNPFVCPNCKKREHLTKIYNNGNKYPIKSYSKNSITAISLAIITLLFIGAFYNARKSGLTYQEEQELKVLESSIVDESVSVPDDFTAKTEIGSIVQSFYEEIEDLQGKQAAKMEELDINYAFFTDLKTLKDVSELIKLREDFRTMREYEVVHYTRSKDLIDDYKEKVATFADKRTYAGKKEDIANFKDGMDKLKEYIGELETFEYSLFDSIDAYLGFLIKENDQISIIDDQVLFEDANAVEKYNSLYEEMFNNLLESENAYSDFVSKINAVFN